MDFVARILRAPGLTAQQRSLPCLGLQYGGGGLSDQWPLALASRVTFLVQMEATSATRVMLERVF